MIVLFSNKSITLVMKMPILVAEMKLMAALKVDSAY